MTTQCLPERLGRGRHPGALRDLVDDSLRRPSDDVFRRLSDDDLLRRARELTCRSRHAEADLLAHLGEIDARRLYLREACSSMFALCTERLHFSEAESWLRIAAARAAREHPPILSMLADGRLHLSAVACLAPHLTAANREAVLSRAVHRPKREVLELVAELSPRPDVTSLIRRLPEPRVERSPLGGGPSVWGREQGDEGPQLRPGDVDRFDSTVSPQAAASRPVPPSQPPAPSQPRLPSQPPAPAQPPARHASRAATTFEPLAPGRFKVQFTASAELRDKLERLRALMRSTVPDGDLAKVIEEAVSEKLARLERLRSAATERPRKLLADTAVRASSRHLPAAVRRAVRARDGGRCAYRDAEGRRCIARERLEYHHRHPHGHGGDHSVGNLALLCRAHNRLLEEIDYGTRGGGKRHR